MTADILSESDRARFWAKVDKRAPDECWPWTASLHTSGGGQLWVSTRGRRPLLAARISWELAHGPVPAQHAVQVTCGERRCVNPAHLRTKPPPWGPVGEASGGAKLTPGKAREIRSAYAAGGVSLRALAERYGVSRDAVHAVVTNRTWREEAT